MFDEDEVAGVVLERLDELTGPDECSKNEALQVILTLLDDLRSRRECLESEIANGDA